MTNPTTPAAEDSVEPLGLLLSSGKCPEIFADATAQRFEFNCRGDRVAGRLLLPIEQSGPHPLLLLLADAGASCGSNTLDFAGPWVREGFAVASIDLSLHGERASAKFSERLLDTIAAVRSPSDLATDLPVTLPRNDEALLVEFTQQSICDLSRTLDALITLPGIDRERVGALGLGHGAAIVAIWASLDPRPKAITLAGCGTVRLPQIDPRRVVASIAPRPILLLEDKPGAGEETLYSACSDPRQLGPSCDPSEGLSAAAAAAALEFFRKQFLRKESPRSKEIARDAIRAS